MASKPISSTRVITIFFDFSLSPDTGRAIRPFEPFGNVRFATSFTDEDRLFFEQIKEKTSKNSQVIQTALANPLDKFQLGIRKFIEEFMIQRMGENDKIVTRYMDDTEFQNAAFPILSKAIFETVREQHSEKTDPK